MIELVLRGETPADNDPAVAAALARLVHGASVASVRGELLARGADRAFVQFLRHVEILDARGALARSVLDYEGVIAELIPLAPPLAAGSFDPDACALSRFAALVVRDGAFVLTSPLSTAELRLVDPTPLVALSKPIDAASFAARTSLNGEVATELLEVLHRGRFLADADVGAELWEPHDLGFHMRSRAGRHAAPLGATWRFAGHRPLPPAVKSSPAGPRVALYRPDLAALERDDPPLQAIVERRASERLPAGIVTARDVGELLFRTARIRSQKTRSVDRNGATFTSDHAMRPYPGSGAMFELEVHLVVSRCDGLDAGAYWYNAEAHELVLVAARTGDHDGILDDAARITGRTAPPQILVCIAARFGRMTWKYEGIAYAGILKDAGVLVQTLCLAATAMELSACSVGFGDSERFARLAGLDPLLESTVAEMLLGGRAPR